MTKNLDKLNYDDLIEEFASKNARRSNFLGVGCANYKAP
jgi:DNA-binding MarR family transcriptional regulator